MELVYKIILYLKKSKEFSENCKLFFHFWYFSTW